ncbi:hypothetical protein FZ025_13970 [Xanthomonas hyacinthi]|uniref:Uncharacterized protein n=1 Tax=Xanthomonas hyacinthi TaxID=56455 RepID=A0A2S7F0V4_9XANT|nr:hypothetical protein XhyaCFBP1156_05650 [Xanthomonas hyacinthi]QGY77693.1 hypothetical protein FZ025_13970 [Xanthomonas hyacinthi]
MLSGVSLSCYQACEIVGKPITARVCGPSNFPNLNSLTFSRGAPFRWTTAESRKQRQTRSQNQRRSAKQKRAGFPSGRAAP